MRVPMDSLRNLPSSPRRKLYFKTFPACISAENRWSSDEGISIFFQIIRKATDRAEGTIFIAFLDDPARARRFLHDWQEGLWESNTGRQAPKKDLSANVEITDENDARSDINIFISFPLDLNIASDTPHFTAVYYVESST